MNNKKPIKEKGGEDIGGQVVQDTTVLPEYCSTKQLLLCITSKNRTVPGDARNNAQDLGLIFIYV
jgi:hypothetical protein